MAEWEIDLDEFFGEIERDLANDFRAIALQLLGRLLLLTPVDTGRLLGAWLFTLDQASDAEQNNDHDVSALNGVTIMSRIILQNNVEYGPYVNSGTDRMAGRFFVETAIESLQG